MEKASGGVDEELKRLTYCLDLFFVRLDLRWIWISRCDERTSFFLFLASIFSRTSIAISCVFGLLFLWEGSVFDGEKSVTTGYTIILQIM